MMNRLNLNFKDHALETEYRKVIYDRYVMQHRFIYGLSIPFYLSFALMDSTAVPSLVPYFWTFRFGVFLPIALFAFLFTYSKAYVKYNQYVAAFVAYVGSIGLIYMTYEGSTQGFYSYKYGLLFALVFITNLAKLRFPTTMMVAISLYIVYMTTYMFYPVIPIDVHKDSLLLFGVIIFLGGISNYFIEYYQRTQFEFMKLLELERDKVKETNERLEEKVLERTTLLHSTNKTLIEVNEKLGSSEYTFRKLFEESADAIMLIEEGFIVNCNQAMVNLLGYYHKSDLKGRRLWSITVVDPSMDASALEKRLETYVKNDDIIIQWWLKLKDEGSFLSEIKMTQIMLNGKWLTHMLVRDITERLEMERMLEYLSYHDQLTGLYNRRFFEEELKRMDVNRNLPISIIYADIDGLREINDTYGFNVGDLLIQKVAIAIKAGCRADDLIARVGGDEYAILLMKTGEEDVHPIINRIQEMAIDFEIGGRLLTVSYGRASKIEASANVFEMLIEAEHDMQRIKRHHKTISA